MVNATPLPLFTPGKDVVPVVQETRWAPQPVWTGAENLVPPTPGGFDPRAVQPVAIRYTDRNIPAHTPGQPKAEMGLAADYVPNIKHTMLVGTCTSFFAIHCNTDGFS